MHDDLAAAFRKTIYRVRLGGREVDLRVGELSAELDAELAARGAAHWAWLTAVNPGARQLPEVENRRRLRALDAEIAARGWAVAVGEALDPSEAWPAEASRLIFAPDLDAISALARRWQQRAYLVGRRGEPAELRWTGEAVRP